MTKEQLQLKFDTDYNWLFRGVLAVNMQQTADERTQETVKYHNCRGFRPADAKFLCSIAKSILAGYGLSQKQVFVTRKKMQKYAGQCIALAKNGIKVQNLGKIDNAVLWTVRKGGQTTPIKGRCPANYPHEEWVKDQKEIAKMMDEQIANAKSHYVPWSNNEIGSNGMWNDL